MLLAPAIDETDIMQMLDMLPENRFHVDIIILPNLLELVDGKHDFLRITLKIAQYFFQGNLLLVVVCESERYLRGTGQRVDTKQRTDTFQCLEKSRNLLRLPEFIDNGI